MPEYYLDNSATTKVLKCAAEKAVQVMTELYGNPSSLHSMGFQAHCLLEEARVAVADSLGASPEELIFTSGGTESDNLAVLGAAQARKRMGNRVVTTAIEHPAVLSAMAQLEKQGFEVIYLQPDSSGNISSRQAEAVIDEKTILVSMMLVNNETGVILPVQEAARSIRRKKSPALLHTDAVQGYLKLPVTPKRLGADLLTVSSHKVHGPKGAGALYIAKGTRILPQSFGGGQERGLRSGTESLPMIAAFAAAVQEAPAAAAEQAHARRLNIYLREKLSQLPEITVHTPEDALPHILNFSAGRVRAETMLHFLAEQGIYLSSGSACGKAKPSHVLTAMGLPKAQVESALRVSFSRLNQEEDIDALLPALRQGLDTIATG